VLASLALSELRIEKYEVGYAEVSVKEALRRDPQNPDAKALLARITLEQGNDVSAANELIEEAHTDPIRTIRCAIHIRAEMLIDNEQYEDALAMLDPAAGQKWLRSAGAGAASSERCSYSIGTKTSSLKRPRRWRARLCSVSSHRIVAERLQVQHRYEEQVAVLEEAVQKNPKDYYAVERTRARVLCSSETKSAAIRRCKKRGKGTATTAAPSTC
jgi:tetratricopeptide (TPR) repeat protein